MFLSSSKSADFEKINRDVRFLIQCFREVLEELGEHTLAEALPWQGADALSQNADSSAAVDPAKTTQMYSTAFQLLTMVEENAVVQYRRLLESKNEIDHFSGLWNQTFSLLKQSGLSDEQIAAELAQTRLEPVLTAHPTEAKRFTVLEQHRALYLLLVSLENQVWTPQERRDIRDEIKVALERLWRTGEIFLEKPDVASEVRNTLYYLRHVFPQVLDILDKRLVWAWVAAGLHPAQISTLRKLPRLSFGTWVGGDRDGHPLVTAEVTRQTLHELRRNALTLLQERLTSLAQRLSLSDRLHPPPAELTAQVMRKAEQLGERGQEALRRNPDETWRQYVNLLLAQLPLDGSPAPYREAAELETDLQRLSEALCAVGAQRLAQADVWPIIRIVQTFGFHLAALDIRQNSRFHDLALAQLLTAAGINGADFPEWDEDRRLAFLNNELNTPRPFTLPGASLGAEAEATLSCYRVLAEYLEHNGPNGLGSLIVSMTRSVSDLLVVYVLAREAGLVFNSPEGLVCRLPVVPLFETIDDLQRSAAIMRGFLAHPVTRRSLAYQQQIEGRAQPTQQIMIGYSDSNKDGGVFASLWNLHKAQSVLAGIGRENGVQIRFFHGRGGSISRGAGPTHRFIRALPHSSVNNDLRLTEQGEVIARKYANRLTAAHNLELLLSGITYASAQHHHSQRQTHTLEPVMERLAEASRRAYHALVSLPGFITFHRQATPIDVIEASRIGSRPARRTGQRTLADLRAIPWVFSWSQARFLLSGWYGVGSALVELQAEAPELFAGVRQHCFDWPPLHYIISNTASNVMQADPTIMQLYAELVEDTETRQRILSRCLDEYERTRQMLEVIYGGSLAEKRPNVHQVLVLRQEPLRRLHLVQIDLLRTWRQFSLPQGSDAQASPEAQRILVQLLLSVNAIANGLGTTG